MSVTLAEGVVIVKTDAAAVPGDVTSALRRGRGGILDAGDEAGRGWVNSFKGSFLGNALASVAVGAATQIGEIIGSGIRAAWDFGWASIDVASSLSEADTALEQVFGAGKGQIDQFASGAARSLGQSELQAKKAAQTFGVYGKSAGLADEANAQFSSSLVTLASDFASFYDTSPEQAIEAIGAALRGESEPIRTYGVLLDDATLRARALKDGLIANTKEALTPQQRVLAAHAEILAQADTASGDFSRTSENLANQQRILAAQFEDAKGKLGESLLPVMTELVGFANDEFMPVFGDMIEKVGPELGDALIEALPSVMDFMSAFVEYLPDLVELGAEALPLIIQAGQLLIPVLQFLTENTGYWYGITNDVLSFIKGDTSIIEFADALGNAGGVVGWLHDVIFGFFDVVSGLSRRVDGATGAVSWFGDTMRNAGGKAQEMGALVWAGVDSAGRAAGELGARVGSAVGNAGMWLYNSGRAVIEGFISGIRSMIGSVGDAIGGVLSFARGFFPNSPAERGPFSGSGWTKLKASGGAVIDEWAAGMREAAPEVPFDLMGITSPRSSRARASFSDDALAPGASAPSSGETHFHLHQEIKSDDPILAARQGAREARRYLGV